MDNMTYLASNGIKHTLEKAVKAILLEKPENPHQMLRQIFNRPAQPLSAEAQAIFDKQGWGKGLTLFCQPVSEASVKIVTALNLLTASKNSFPDSFNLVIVNFNDEALGENEQHVGMSGKALSLGVKSAEYAAITGGHSKMPALALDGVLYIESDQIVKMLAEMVPESDPEIQAPNHKRCLPC